MELSAAWSAAVSSVTPSPLAPNTALTLSQDANGPSNVAADSVNPGSDVMECNTHVKGACVLIPENVATIIAVPGWLQFRRPSVFTFAVSGSVVQTVLAVTSVVVPLE
jgi:hypothetical protein